MGPVSSFHKFIQLSQYYLLKALSFHWVFLAPLSQSWLSDYAWACFWTPYSVPLVYFLFLCQYHKVLMIIDLQYSLKSGSLIPSTLLLFLRSFLAILHLSWFHTNFRNFFPTSIFKNMLDLTRFHIRIYKLVYLSINILTALISSTPWTQGISPFIYLFFRVLFINVLQFSE